MLTPLGFGLLVNGRPQEAEAHLRECLAIWQQWPEEWRNIAASRSLLGSALTALGRFDEAEPLLLESYSVFVDNNGPSHSRTVRSLRRVVELYEAWNRTEAAERYRALLPDQ